jgi:hypothetical protein
MVKVLYKGGPGYRIEKPFTAEEQRAFDSPDPNDWPKGYDPRYFLLSGEVWPRSQNKEIDLDKITSMTFYGAAPHRPNPPAEIAAAAEATARRRKQRR